eukprot:178412-Lingulodinium_polyedra.AAC.1
MASQATGVQIKEWLEGDKNDWQFIMPVESVKICMEQRGSWARVVSHVHKVCNSGGAGLEALWLCP